MLEGAEEALNQFLKKVCELKLLQTTIKCVEKTKHLAILL
jgi:hypothetical protein